MDNRTPLLGGPKSAKRRPRAGSFAAFAARACARKPLGVILAEEGEETLGKQLSLADLVAIGIGGTVGSGVFVLCGQIAHEDAGPAVLLSWLLAGVGCVLSGLSYAEMSARIPSAGSCYAYSYFALGELPAYVASWLLTLEYAVSGCAVARSWGDKVVFWVGSMGGGEHAWLADPRCSLLAGAIQAATVALLLRGLSLGKRFVNGVTVLKVCAFMLFMIYFLVFYLLTHSLTHSASTCFHSLVSSTC